MRISPSTLHRAWDSERNDTKCVWWAREEIPTRYEPMGAAAQTGVTFGAIVESILTGRPNREPMDAQADRLVHVWREQYGQPTGWRAEVSFAIHTLTGAVRELGDGLTRQQRARLLKPGEIQATLDAWDPETRTVIDWKTGAQWGLDPAPENLQLRTYAYACASAWGLDSVRVVVSHVTEDGVYESEHTYDALDLEATVPGMLRKIVRAIPESRPVAGAHCKWCPAASACPAMASALAAVEPRLPVVQDVGAIQTSEQASRILDTLLLVEPLYEAAWKAAKAYVDAHGEVTLPDGRVYGFREEQRRSIRATDRALDVLEEAFGREAVTEILKQSVSLADIERQIRATVGSSRQRAAARREREEQIMGALTECGALSVTTIKRHVVKEKSE